MRQSRTSRKNRAARIQTKPLPEPQNTDKETPVQFSTSTIITLIAALFILTFNVQAFEIPSGSMEPTLLVGDHLLVDRADVGREADRVRFLPHHTIKRGDILVFLSPAKPDMHLVKRVVGVPGDRIRLEHGVLIRNGVPLRESYVIHDGTYVPYRDEFPAVVPTEMDGLTPYWSADLRSHVQNGELVVPPGNYFAMGDNRDNSFDSRYWGFIPEENIIGRPLLIYWSFEQSPEEYLKTGVGDRIAHVRNVMLHFFDETRWRRTMSIPR
jgi:signal peptidase I